MILKNIDGALLKEMVINGALLLERHKEEINALNVFPVPDGDTGTNMAFTMKGAVAEINNAEVNGIDVMGEALSRGALKGARGNSGVILSQIFRGFYLAVKGKTVIDAVGFAQALQSGVETAYKAVMKPREGTILTVSRAVADAATVKALENDNIIDVMDYAIEKGIEMLLKTPDMLDVLKKAGVVDAGGEGLLMIYKGYLAALRGEEPAGDITEFVGSNAADFSPIIDNLDEITFGYCTEFFITNIFDNVTNHDIEILKSKLDQMGDSLVVVGDTELLKIHVHTDMPGKALQYGLRLGDLSKIKIENMREQNEEIKAQAVPKKKNGVVAVTSGKGLEAIFHDLGVDVVVEGGQTMNPSTEDIAKAIEEANAEHVYVLPNNSNIIMAAQQTVDIVDAKVYVIPSKSTPQGISAMLNYDPENDNGEMADEMTAALGDVVTGQVTFAVRDSSYDDLTIKEGDIMGLINNKIAVVGQDVEQVVLDLLDKMVETNEDAEIITLYKGVDTEDDQAQNLLSKLEEKFEDFDVDLQDGGQPLYYYIISAE